MTATILQGWETHITYDRVLELHAVGIQRHGGSSRLRSPGCVEGSLGSAWNAELYQGEELGQMGLTFAAHLLLYLVKNHCFEDGNKRVAWSACIEVLATLGLTVDVSPEAAADYVNSLAETTRPSPQDVVLWLAPRLVGV